MKKLFVALLLMFVGFASQAQAIEKIDLNGTVYTVTKKIPEEMKYILGEYQYEWGKNGKEPIVYLSDKNEGVFQPHMVAPIPITFWLDCDEKGVVRKKTGINGRYQVTLLIKYGESASRNYATGTYDLMGVTVVPDENYAVIYGERYKKLNP